MKCSLLWSDTMKIATVNWYSLCIKLLSMLMSQHSSYLHRVWKHTSAQCTFNLHSITHINYLSKTWPLTSSSSLKRQITQHGNLFHYPRYTFKPFAFELRWSTITKKKLISLPCLCPRYETALCSCKLELKFMQMYCRLHWSPLILPDALNSEHLI